MENIIEIILIFVIIFSALVFSASLSEKSYKEDLLILEEDSSVIVDYYIDDGSYHIVYDNNSNITDIEVLIDDYYRILEEKGIAEGKEKIYNKNTY